MTKTTINIAVNDQELLLKNRPTIASGGQDENLIKFSFSSEWDDFDKTAIFYNTKDEVYEVELNEDNEVIIPVFVTVEPCILYISVYGENGNTVKTSETINYIVVQGAIVDGTDPLAPVKEKAYKEGYDAGYDDGGFYFNQMIDWVEDLTTFGNNNRTYPWFAGNANHTIALPYFKTSKLAQRLDASQGVPFGGFVKEIGFDFSNQATTVQWGWLRTSAAYLKKVIITMGQHTNAIDYMNCFQTCPSLEVIYFDYFKPANSAANMFNGCYALTKIGGFNSETRDYDDELGVLDFSTTINTTNMFNNCEKLEEVRFKSFSLGMALRLQQSSNLSKETVLSLINALSDEEFDVIYLNSNVKDKMTSEWYCVFNPDTGLYEDAVYGQHLAMPYSLAVMEKNWGLM